MGPVACPRQFQRRFVICRLGLAMSNPYTNFEVSTITCNEDMKGNAKCKNSRSEPPEILKQSRDHNHAPFVIKLLELIQPTYLQNLTTSGSAVPVI